MSRTVRNTPEYQAWSAIKQRCFNPRSKYYPYYGGRGITMCREWVNSFDSFLREVGPRPSSEYSIDRCDNDGNYEPGNVRWATKQEQSSNRRTVRWIEIDGVTKTFSDWARQYGLSPSSVSMRLDHGWSYKQAFTHPKRVSLKWGSVIGKRFGKLIVLEYIRKDNYTRLRCVCDCGKETIPQAYRVLHGATKSCGCGMRAQRRALRAPREATA